MRYIIILFVILTASAAHARAEPAASHCSYCDKVLEKSANMPLFGLATKPAQKAFAQKVAPLFAESANNLLALKPSAAELAPMGFDQFDQFRLTAYKASAWDAFSDIYQHNPNDPGLKKIVSLLGKPAKQLAPQDIAGQWRCRTHKLAGIGDNITSYRYFKCEITLEEGQLRLNKLSGSQRIHGPLYAVDNGYAVKGCGYYWYADSRCEYGGGKANYADRRSEYDEAGLLVFVNQNHGALLLPMPFFESKLDILEFTR